MAVSQAENDKHSVDKLLDDFCIEKGKLIKEALLGSVHHTNYDKRSFRESVTKIKSISPQPVALSDTKKKDLRKQKELQEKPSISPLSVIAPDLEELRSQTSALLKRSVVSKVIADLARDVSVGAWVQQGLSLHKGTHKTNTCRFCGNEFSAQRRAELEEHFNDAFASFQHDIEQAISDIERQQQTLTDVTFPDESRFYEHLLGDIQLAVTNAKNKIEFAKQMLGRLKETLESKKASLFHGFTLEDSESTTGSADSLLQTAIDAVNAVIAKHETTTNNLNEAIRQAFQALEQDYVLEALPKFDELNRSAIEADTAFATAKEKPEELQRQIDQIERDIVEHRRPAEELNQELQAYLGRYELQFEVKDTGYALTRGGQPALNLSEGERTAIAFLYFLKSLEDRAFDLKKSIVVIDDPVSSLDANALFSSFGYMKERTKASGQLIILTHNFAFFRQVKNWFHHLKGQKKQDVAQRPARFYTILRPFSNNSHGAVLSTIDRLLEEFESEYHFLFKQVHAVAKSEATAGELAQYYGMPNIARRLIETFLAYRFPDCGGDLVKRFERVNFDSAKKTRILRFLNTYSHSGGISDPEHDPSVLAETGEVMKAILELMQASDRPHYQGMIKLIEPSETEE